MQDTSLTILLSILIFLIMMSAYFSSSETAMMALNRYRLRHLIKHNHKGAIRAGKLLEKPDRLIGIILIGNNLVNFIAASLGTAIAVRLWGNVGFILAPILLTIIVLIFAEVTPKTIAALYPEKIAYPSSIFLLILLKVCYPAVWMINSVSNGLVRLCGLKVEEDISHHLTKEELRTVLDESGDLIPVKRHGMLMNILDLEKATVTDIMVPRNEVVGIDLDDDIEDIMEFIVQTSHTLLPVFKGDLNDVLGLLHMRNITRMIGLDEINKAELLQLTEEAYFVPETTPLHTQLFKFQNNKRRMALVVDEYGDVQGIVTLQDILEEIVGNFTTNFSEETDDIHPQEDGSYIIDGTATVREINKALDWDLPIDGPKTLNGLLTEILEIIPEKNVCVRLPFHCVEILNVQDNAIKTAKMWAQEPFNIEQQQGNLFS
ncbi:MAG: HlyC/CorC family transporter [Gammaproteobacteria bacterium]|nr:HlyC/CorC family transporter [Gammaproteobacteria bacterium]MBT6042013.1 HlyC/CorC family transporter [Gammaproteobacteria bacterium]